MAIKVRNSLAAGRHLAVEAGTGTGKTLAYLVPLVLSGVCAVISTGTKNMQDQLIREHIPILEDIIGRPLHIAVMKGRNNYLCKRKLDEMTSQQSLPSMEDLELETVRNWSNWTETGDRSEISDLPKRSRLWPKINARRETCSGQHCGWFDDCFLTRMRRNAREEGVDLIIVNHYLFFADLSKRQEDAFGPLLPEHEAVVFDEAHLIEDIVSRFFGAQIDNSQIRSLERDTIATAKNNRFGSPRLALRLEDLRTASEKFFRLFSEIPSRSPFEERTAFRRRHSDNYDALLIALGRLRSQLTSIQEQGVDAVIPLWDRTSSLEAALRFLLDDGPKNDSVDLVYWIEKPHDGVVSLIATPIEVGSILNEKLFKGAATTILTSATLSVDGKFDYLRDRLGMDDVDDLMVPGHFDYRTQTLLYLPKDMPNPWDGYRYVRRVVEEVLTLTNLSRGRAFVLCTSYKQMHRIHKDVSAASRYPCLLQGESPNSALLEKFRSTDNCILFGTSSFWQGVDVPGDQLSMVIVDKLPFAVPSDPVVKARMDRIEQTGRNSFVEFQVPSAALTLKQGFGRLIRTGSDRGVLALLDGRILKKKYGQTFLSSLPDYARTSKQEDVAAFFGAGLR